MKFQQVKVSAQEAGNNDHSRFVSLRHAQAVIYRRSMQQKQLRGKQRLGPERDFRFRPISDVVASRSHSSTFGTAISGPRLYANTRPAVATWGRAGEDPG